MSTGGSAAPPQQQFHQQPKRPHPLGPSLFAGAVQAVLFNPVDRALYLRVHNREKHLLVWSNWSHPFQGFANAAVYRTISGATYLFYQDSFRYLFELCCQTQQQVDNIYLRQFVVGTLAGAVNGWSLNGFQYVKFQVWSRSGSSFFGTAKHIAEHGGLRMLFFRGAGVSVVRDVSFGIAYEIIRTPGLKYVDGAKSASSSDQVLQQRDPARRRWSNESTQFAWNVAAGSLASTVSSPFNYCRNIVYGAPASGSPMRVPQLLLFLAKECASHANPVSHLNARLNVGWGTLRVGFGIAIGQFVFQKTSAAAESKREHSTR